jgi:hypothetical protein
MQSKLIVLFLAKIPILFVIKLIDMEQTVGLCGPTEVDHGG